MFLAGQDEGNFLVTASAGEVRGTAGVTVARPGVTLPPGVNPPPVKEVTGLSWEGEVPPQKWMNFYTKVLSKFAREKSLRLTVRVEVSSGESIPEQKLEEVKIAFRELGLSDHVAPTS